MSTFRFILVYFKNVLLGLRKKNVFPPPESVEGYKLYRVRKNRRFFVGFYRNEAGKNVLVKIWSGAHKDVDYYLIIHEIRMHRLFARVLERTDLPESIRDLRIPKLLYTREEKEIVIMMREYVDGICPRDLSDGSGRILTYQKVVEFMRFIGGQLTLEERRGIPVWSVVDFMTKFFLTAAYALSRRPEKLKEISRAALGILSSLPAIIKNARLVLLAHKDLHLGNIVLDADGIYVIDLEKCMFTNPMYEYVITLAKEWRDVEFRDALLGQIITEKRFVNASALFRGFALLHGIHRIAEGVRPESLNRFSEFFHYATSFSRGALRAPDKKAESIAGHP